MKVSNKILNLLMIVTFLSSFGMSFANASSSVKGNLAVNFSFSDVLKEAAKTFTGGSDATVTQDIATDTKLNFQGDLQPIATGTDETVIDDTPDADKNSCEHFDSTVINILNLETASADTRQKIDNVEVTIDDESTFRDSILSSIKDFLGLQQNDKKVFGKMKQDIADAKSYYDKVDSKVFDTENFLDENYCENVKLETAKKLDNDTQSMVTDEAIFRKAFAASLKDKMKILQDSVKSAKK